MLSDDVLPQPYRFINKLVNRCVDDAFEGIRLKHLQENAHRRFNPSRSLNVVDDADVATVLTAADAAIGNTLRPAAPTATHVGAASTVYGFKSGNAVVYSTASGEPLGIVSVDGPGEAVSAVTAAHNVCVFAAAAGSKVACFYALAEDVAAARAAEQAVAAAGESKEQPAPQSAATPAQAGASISRPESRATSSGESPVVNASALAMWFAFGPEVIPELAGSKVASVTLSDDCSHMAVVLASQPPRVTVLRLPPCGPILRGEAIADASAVPAPTIVCTAEPPSMANPPAPPAPASSKRAAALPPLASVAAATAAGSVAIKPVVMFICDDPATAALDARAQPTSAKHKHLLSTDLTRSLCIAWAGSNVFSTYALVPTPDIQPPPPLAVTVQAPTAVPQVDVAAAAAAPSAKGGKDKAAASGKAAAGADADPMAASNAANSMQSGVNAKFAALAAGPANFTPGCPRTPWDEVVIGSFSSSAKKDVVALHRTTPHFITTASLCRYGARTDLIALGCGDGCVVVWSALRRCVLHTMRAVPVRQRRVSVKPMADGCRSAAASGAADEAGAEAGAAAEAQEGYCVWVPH